MKRIRKSQDVSGDGSFSTLRGGKMKKKVKLQAG